MKNTILIVGDDSYNLMLLSNLLKSEYEVRTALSGAAGLEAAEKFLPDLILLDILIKESDGFQVFQALKDSNLTAHIPIVLLTGLDNRNDEIKGLELGAVDYINKPFDDIIVKLRVHQQIRNINQIRTIAHLSMYDQLTEIPNRRNFDDRMNAEWGRAIRENLSIGLLIVDIDHFKLYNDKYGHQQGDKTLKAVAQGINNALTRSSDFSARWGGEEFTVLLPNTDAAGGVMVAERIREAVAALEIPCANGDISRVTVSIGVTIHTPTRDCSIDEFISDADKALYQSKSSGRNKVYYYKQ